MKFYTFFILILFPGIVFSQGLKPNKKIKSDSDFNHAVSGITAPISLGDFSRSRLFTNSKSDSVFSAHYENKNLDLKYNFSIFPTAIDEERLINFYRSSLEDKRFSPKQLSSKPVFFKKDNFRINGISGVYSHLDNLIDYRVYDAGLWIFVSELSQKNNDTLALLEKHEEFLKQLVPTKIVENNPLSKYTNNYIAEASFRDSLMLRSTLSSSFNKLKWSYENIDKYERASGIPGIYLEYQMAGINGFIDYKTEKNPKPSRGTSETNKMISFLTKLRNDNFLDEFLMEQYYYLLISKNENRKFDFEGYRNWKLYNSIEFDVNKKYYLLVNSRRKADLTKNY